MMEAATSSMQGLIFASALSTAPTVADVASELLGTLEPRLPEGADLIVLFVTPHHAAGLDGLARRLIEALAPSHAEPQLIACTTEGVIGTEREVEGGPGACVLAGRLPGVVVESFRYEDLGLPAAADHPTILTEAFPRSIEAGGPKAILLLADPFSTPLIRLLPAFETAFPGTGGPGSRPPVIGGLASGGRKAGQNRLMRGRALMDRGAVGVALAGAIDVQTTVSQGCRPVGRPFVITQAKRHVVQQLGGVNALEAVQSMAQDLPDRDRELMQSNGVFVGRVINEYKARFGRGDFLVRNVIGVDPDSGFIAINDPQVRVGQTVQFHVRDGETALEDLDLLLQAQRIHGPGAGGLLFSCTSRGRKLFDRPHADARAIHEALGTMPLAGFFAAGEIGPVGDRSFIHGHTASLVVFRSPPTPGTPGTPGSSGSLETP